MPKRIAILGATSHIALTLIEGLGRAEGTELELFARSPDRVTEFLSRIAPLGATVRCHEIHRTAALDKPIDAVINCVGFGTPEKISTAGLEIFSVTERFDDAVLEIVARNKNCVYINFSSGAVYGRDRRQPIRSRMEARFRLDSLGPADAYAVAKLNSEAKHRACPSLSVIDLRVFGFFSRYIDLSSRYLVAELTRSARDRVPFCTNNHDIVRDFVAPADLCALVRRCVSACGVNAGFDVFSRAPVTKSALIEAFTERYGLRVVYGAPAEISPTGGKDQYFSHDRSALKTLGYEPTRTALEAIIEEADAIIGA